METLNADAMRTLPVRADRQPPPWTSSWIAALPATRWLQFFPPRLIEWNEVRLTLPNLPRELNGLRILHLTDFHLRRHLPPVYGALVARIRNNPPDLLLMTGDFVNNKRNPRPAMRSVRKLLEMLAPPDAPPTSANGSPHSSSDAPAARIGCYAIHGNHDQYSIGRSMGDLPITFLDGRRVCVAHRGATIELIGLPGLRRYQTTPKLLASFPPRAPGTLRIVLSHFPDNIQRVPQLEADLFMAGHTHGGQICLPGGMPLIWHDTLPRPLSRGAHRVGSTWLIVSRGLGYTGLPLRAWCAPEVVEIQLFAQP